MAAENPIPPAIPPFVILFDGVCGLCSRSVAWLIAHEHQRDLVFAPLQGETAARLRALHPAIPAGLGSVVYVEPGGVHLRSRAFLHAARHLEWPWRWAYRLRWLPGLPLDLLYRLIIVPGAERSGPCPLPSVRLSVIVRGHPVASDWSEGGERSF